MKVFYHLEAKVYYFQKYRQETNVQKRQTLLPKAEEFIEQYKDYKEQESDIDYIFQDEEKILEAIVALEKYGLSGKRHYRIQLEPNEIKTYPAFYLVVPSQMQPIIYDNETGEKIKNVIFLFDEETGAEIIDLEVLEGYEIIQDLYDDSDKIVVSSRIKEVLEAVTRGVNWIPIGTTTTYEWIPISREDIGKYDDIMEKENGEVYKLVEKTPQTWFLMEVQEKLPDPIVVPFPREIRFISALQTDCVFSDGRNVITQASIDKLANYGIAVIDEVRTPEGIYKEFRSLVASGRVIKALFDANITGFYEGFATPLWENDLALNASLQESSNK